MQRALPENPSFRLRAAAAGVEGGAGSSVLRVARYAAISRAAPVLQRQRAPSQLSFDFHRGGR